MLAHLFTFQVLLDYGLLTRYEMSGVVVKPWRRRRSVARSITLDVRDIQMIRQS